MLAAATATTTNSQSLDGKCPIATIKMERRASSTSESSLEHLDLGCTPKKLGSLSTDTSTPQRINKNGLHHRNSTDQSAFVNPQAEHINSQKNAIVRPHERLQDSDEANDYDDEESPDEQRLKHNHTSRSHRHHKRRSTTTRLDKNTSVHLEYNADNPSSLRKKFRFNRSISASEQGTPSSRLATCNNESGFVDTSCSSHFLNASIASVAACAPTADTVSASVSASGSATTSHSSSAASSPRDGVCGVTSSSASSPESGIGERDREDIKFVCTICEVVSATRHEFTNHIRCHNYASGDTENFTCAICSKVLSSASSLDRHVLVHTGERPFNCKYCHLTFTTNGNMHRHMRTHKQHQHNHHHRRHSNGTKNSNSKSNSNNAGDNNATTAAAIVNSIIATTTTSSNSSSGNNNNIATYAQLSNDLACEAIKATSTGAVTATATAATTTTAAAAVTTTTTATATPMAATDANTSDTTATALAGRAGVNGSDRRLNSSGVESCESDGGCSTDSSSAISRGSNNHSNVSDNNLSLTNANNNNCNNTNNNNNNNINSNNNIKSDGIVSNFKRKSSDLLDADDIALMKRRVKTTINNNIIGEDDADDVDNKHGDDIIAKSTATHTVASSSSIDDDEHEHQMQACITNVPVCPVCNASEFTDMQSLDAHLDSEHSDIPAKCRHCEVVFRTHHQLNLHPCTQSNRTSRKLSQVDCSKCGHTFTEGKALELHARECNAVLLRRVRNISASSTEPDPDLDPNEPDRNNQQHQQQQQGREDFFRQLYLQNKPLHTHSLRLSTSPPHSFSDEPLTENVHEIKLEADNEHMSNNLLSQLSHDSKDLADIQSILNMTSSSSTSNFLKSFEQSVNTPSSNYSLDKDEEEAQDVFTSEFRKMKLRGEFPCKLCSAVFPNLRALKGHNRIHLSAVGPTGPFRCNMCPYSICDKAALVRHMRTHNGDRPYECAECNYAFTTKANCERHLRNRHAKTTRDEVKRAIIYHPSEDSACDDAGKKIPTFSSPDFDDDVDLKYQQHQPKDRSTPVSHLKEMLTSESPTTKPMKIQVKSLEQLLDKSSSSIGSTYNTPIEEKSARPAAQLPDAAPIDLSMDVLDLSKKPTNKSDSNETTSTPPNTETSIQINEDMLPQDGKLDFNTLEKNQQLLLAQQRLINDTMPNIVDHTHYLQQLYRNLVFQPLNPFFLQNLNDLQKFAPLMNHMFAGASAHATPSATVDIDKANMNSAPTILPQISPLMSEKTGSHTFSPASPSSINPMLPKPLAAPGVNNALSISRVPHIPPTVLSGGPVKMVIKNGVLMPKQKQRRYRTERPFACEHCSARFTLRSNMERHVKQQHPQFYAQRQRSGHHIMRGRGASSMAAMNNITHLQATFSQTNNNNQSRHSYGSAPISEQVKYAILAQQLKARKDTDILQQALAHGSRSITSNHHMLLAGSTNLGPIPTKNPQFPFHQLNPSMNITNSLEDDEPKLIIDEDEDDDVEEMYDNTDEAEGEGEGEVEEEENYDVTENIFVPEINLPAPIEAVKLKPPINESKKETTHKRTDTKSKDQAPGNVGKIELKKPMREPLEKIESTNKIPTPTSSAKTMKAMIAQAESVGKSLKQVASSSFKDESQDLVPVSKLVDNATNNAVSFNNYFRRSDIANHMEQSDEEGLVASGSASESNNSGTEDVTTAAEPKKKSAYSSAPNRVSCPYCQRMFPWSSSLRRHILTHTGQKPFKCSHCPLLFTTKSNCDRHLLRKHGDVESAVSVYVPTEDVNEPIPVPKSVEEIEQQQRQREEEERKCKAEEALLERERREKEQRAQQEQEQQRQLLKQLAAAQQQLNTPIVTNANANANANANVKAIDLNVVPSTELPFKCHLCESSFGERGLCLEHIKAQHTQEFALLYAKGAIASEAEANQTQLIEEEERRAGDETGSCAMRGSSGKFLDYNNRKVICAFCMRRFWSTEDLRRHMRTHTGERPFQCEICLRKFTLKHSMLRHMKKHINSHINGAASGDLSTTGNSGSDYSDDEQTPTPIAISTMPTLPTLPALPTTQQSNVPNVSAAAAAYMRTPKVQELLNKANEWRCSRRAGEHKENISEEHNGHQSDLIGNLLGISDQGILNKLLSSADEAAKFLGVDK